MAKYKYSFTSDGKVTSKANQVIKFPQMEKGKRINKVVQFISFETFDKDLRYRINDEETIHWVPKETEDAIMQDISISKVTIIDAGVDYYFTAFAEK